MKDKPFKYIDENNKKRKKYKDACDKLFSFSLIDDETNFRFKVESSSQNDNHVLLSEGTVVNDDTIRCYISKGTLDKFVNGKNIHLNNIDDSFIGTINIGHLDYISFPYPIGTWKKTDFSLSDVDNDGRRVLYTKIGCFDKDSVFYNELERLQEKYNIPIGLSAEFIAHLDDDKTEELGFPVIDEVFIDKYAVVGECGDINCADLKLGGLSMDETKETVVVEDEVVEETAEVVEDTTEVVEEDTTEEETTEVEQLRKELEELKQKNQSLLDELNTIKEQNTINEQKLAYTSEVLKNIKILSPEPIETKKEETKDELTFKKFGK